jgi:hypothetical protein
MACNPFRLAYALLASIVAAGGVLFYAEAAPLHRAGSKCSASAPSHDPLVATRQFVETAVARVHVERSYSLVTPGLRQGMSCAEWMTGTIPVQPFLEVVPEQARYRVVQRSRGERMVLVHLVSRSRDWPETTFMLELHESDGGWLASSWTPAGGMAVPAAT